MYNEIYIPVHKCTLQNKQILVIPHEIIRRHKIYTSVEQVVFFFSFHF